MFVNFQNLLLACLNEKTAEFNTKKESVLQEAENLDAQKNILITYTSECKMIKERFEVTKIQTILDHEIRRLHDAYSGNLGSNSEDSFEVNLQKFKENRKRYYRFSFLRQKLEDLLSKR